MSQSQLNGLKIVTIDIETFANLVWSWELYGKNWSAIDKEMEWFPFSIGVKWLGQKTRYYSLADYKNWKPVITRHKGGAFTVRPPDIRPLMEDIWNILDVADVVVGWNSKAFDVKKLNDQLIALGFPPYSPFKQVDVMAEKKKLTKSNSNSLDSTSEHWGTGRKVKHEGWPLWMKCIEDDKKAQKLMKAYCIRDVDITEKNYLFMRPWIRNHPHVGAYRNLPDACRICGREDMWQSRGLSEPTMSGARHRRYQCQTLNPITGKAGCSWSRSRKPEVKGELAYV